MSFDEFGQNLNYLLKPIQKMTIWNLAAQANLMIFTSLLRDHDV